MATSNASVASRLREYSAILAMEGADRFRIKAYRRAADTIETLDDDLAKMVAEGRNLQSLPGVGPAISGAIREIVETGSMPQLDSRRAAIRPELAELAAKPRLDAKKVSRVYKKLNIHSLRELREKLDDGTILETLGPRMAFHIRQGLDERPRLLLSTADEIASRIESFLATIPGATRVARAGSLRRKQETIGDLNFLVATDDASVVQRRFADFGGVQKTADESRPGRFTLSSGLGVTLVCTSTKDWGSAWIEQTGSDAHLSELRLQAAGEKKALPRHATETGVYKSLGLAFIEPELREGRGEVQAAASGTLPKLVELSDLRGDLHMHTTASDGSHSIEDMAAAARSRGYEYIGITDHSKSLKIANGLSEERLLAQIKRIDEINARSRGFTILKSAEVDILEDGSLDYPDSLLKELDYTICSVHSRFSLPRRLQTDRIRRAMDNRHFTILGHATGRLLLKREGYDMDFERLVEHAKGCGCLFEINSSPDRLDLSAENARLVKAAGIPIAVDTDAHRVAELELAAWGINQARRGWLEARDVLNTRPLQELKRAFKRC